MPEIQQLLPLIPSPGIQRDGTTFDAKNLTYSDGEWVRFQRGRPRKMGGYMRMSQDLRGKVRKVLVNPCDGYAKILCYSQYGIESITVDQNGVGSGIVDRSPSGFTTNESYSWSSAVMYDDAAGANESVILAIPTIVNYTDTTVTGQLYSAVATDNTVFASVSGVTGRGVFVTQPYAVVFGPYGSVSWSNENEPLNFTTGSAGSDRVTAAAIVAGLPLPSGSGAGGLLFSIDSVIRMDWVGGQAIFKFTRISNSSSIISDNAVVELDGTYYWVGEDKFYISDGSSVQTLPNTTNFNYFFDNLNFANRRKVWAEKNQKYGEIIWHFPFGDNTECSHTVVFNTYEKCWYDYELSRTAGANFYTHPVLASDSTDTRIWVTLSGVSGVFDVGDNVEGTTSQAVYKIVIEDSSDRYLLERVSAETLILGETLNNTSDTGSGTIATLAETTGLYYHEFGKDKVEGDFQTAIQSSFTTSEFSLIAVSNLNNWTRVIRYEPDFIQVGDLSIEMFSKEFANSSEVSVDAQTFSSDTEYVDMRIQGRHIRMKITSNSQGGDYQLGKSLLHMEPGDIRS